MSLSFGYKELIACLLCLGFAKQLSTGSSHLKYKSPHSTSDPNLRPFITVILERKDYDKHTRGRYLGQIKRLGFSLQEIKTCMP